ncbi:MAG: choice-of-anchor D domain-containing protein [Bacteroidales bacterium]|nr:choice-of-anchor D domain-containing protein [Bacteroidales bacterium]
MNITLKYITIIIAGILLFAGNLRADNTLSVVDGQVGVNEGVLISIHMDNSDAIVAFQMDIPIPDGISYQPGSATYNLSRVNGHEISDTLLPSGVLRIIGYSLSNTPFSGNSGELLNFQLQSGVIPGTYPLNFATAVLGDVSSNNIITSAQNGVLTVTGPDISLSSSDVDFGEVPLLQIKDRYVTVYNNGNAALNVQQITSSNSYFTVIGEDSFTIEAGSNRSLQLRFSSEDRGEYAEVMTITSDDADQPELQINLSATAFAVNELHTGDVLAFSGEYSVLDFSMNNMDAITSIQFDLILPSPMTYVKDSVFLSSRKNNHYVSASMISSNVLRVVAYSVDNSGFNGDDGLIVQLGFDVEGTGGYYSLQINNIVLGDTEGVNGVSATTNGYLHIAAADIYAVNSINFGDVSILETKTKSFTITNTGQDTLEIHSAVFTDPVFSTGQAFPLFVNPGKNTQLDVTFSSANEGPVSGSMKLINNDPDENPHTVSLSANAYIPNYIKVQDSVYSYGDTMFVDVNVDNLESFTGFQFDLHHTDSLSFLPDLIELGERAGNHMIQASQINEKTIRVLAFSMSHQTFSGNTGSVVRIPFVGDSDVYGQIPLSIDHAILGNAQSLDILWGVVNNPITIVKPQQIIFRSGWNMVSFNVVPPNTSLINMLQPLVDNSTLVKVSDEAGGFIQELPNNLGWINTIGEMQNTEGYYLKASQNDTIYVPGTEVSLPFDIPLHNGWNMIGYPLQNDQDAMNILNTLITSDVLIKAVDENGGFIQFIPNYGWWNSIGDMKPGKGYYVRVNATSNLHYSQAKNLTVCNVMSINSQTVYFNNSETENAFMPMHFVLTNPESMGLNVGDEIAIFDQELCVGASVYQGGSPLVIVTTMDDPDTPQIEGYQSGNEFTAKVFLANSGVETPVILQGEQNNVFHPLETWLGDVLLDIDQLISQHVSLEQNRPNPVTTNTIIDYQLPVNCTMKLSLLDVNGSLIDVLDQGARISGKHSISYNTQSLSSGIYLIKLDVSMQGRSVSKVKRMVKNN